ncbi:Peroxin-3-domain-containing protein [Mycena leptocephala]|nr:Peroxin-3-domain-containing protein [Mycena leptocephala]
MFDSLRARMNIPKTIGIVGTVYIVRRYISDRLEDVKEQMEQERVAKDNLKRRFSQTQSDISYTILMLIPALSEQVLREMDVDSITHELQAFSKARISGSSLSASIASSVELVNAPHGRERSQDARSESDTSHSGSASTHSWIETGQAGESREMILGESVAPVQLSDSLMTTTSTDTDSSSNVSMQGSAVDSTSGSESSRPSKAELWNELKMLTFTRTLTTVYTVTLLTLLTTVQLTLLARSRYVRSVIQLEKQQRRQHALTPDLTMLLGMGLGFGGGMEALLGDDREEEADYAAGFGWPESDDDDDEEEVASAKYLTMTWWILHVGWKDVGERVRRGVEEVFSGVSLKTKLAPSDLHRLVRDVRRRVEHEVTFEGTERKVDFHTTLLPQTPETTQHVLRKAATPLSRPPSSRRAPPKKTLQCPARGDTRDHLLARLCIHLRGVSRPRDGGALNSVENAVFATSSDPATPGEEVRIRLAGLLPGLARWSHLALNGLPNELIDVRLLYFHLLYPPFPLILSYSHRG